MTTSDWIAFGALALSIAWPAFQFFTKSTAKDEAQELIDAQSKILNDHEIRLVRMEERMSALPGQRDHQQMTRSVSAIEGELKAVAKEIAELRRGQDRTEKEIRIINETLQERAA
jgi:hypothetical protein